MSLTKVSYSMITGASLNVKDFGAVGDGVTDDTAAFNAASAALQSYQSLYIPAGNYVANSNAILFRGKTNIDIYGDGDATRIAPTNQGYTPTKQDYHSTFCVDQCSFVTVRDMVIESKGENYGNADAYSGLSGGDPRTNAIINYGGSAVVVTRSDNVTLQNLTARFCGSVGVYYLSSCEAILVENCFSNAASLGYGNFAADNWADATVKTNRTYKFLNCRCSRETATYSGKAGIVTEGDQATQRLLNVDVVGGVFENTAIGGDAALVSGGAITAYETRLNVSGITTNNCYFGVYWAKKGGAVDYSFLNVTGCTFINNNVAGISYLVGNATGGSNISITGNRINTNSVSAWAALSSPTYDAVKYSSGIVAGAFTQGSTTVITGNSIIGGQYGIYATDNTPLTITGNYIEGILGSIAMWGGGNLVATANRCVATSASAPAVYMNTQNRAATASYNSNFLVSSNSITTLNNSSTDYAVVLTGNNALYSTTQIKGNTVTNGVQVAFKGSATLFNVDPITLNTLARVTSVSLIGANTAITVQMPMDWNYDNYTVITGTDNVNRAINSFSNNYTGIRGLLYLVVLTDVRSFYAVGATISLLA